MSRKKKKKRRSRAGRVTRPSQAKIKKAAALRQKGEASNKGAKTQKILELTFEDQNPPASWPPVSLCMIVKDEEKNLAGCLESMGDFASEIIIVDTGSTDRTVEIAQSFGAQVKHFTWINDFSAARNESIKDAKSDWIFWMDADDRLAPGNLIRLKQAAASGRADAYACPVVSRVEGRGSSTMTADHIRLFRNGLGLQFEGPIHESVTPAALRQGLAIAQTNVRIEHTGYAIGHQGLKQKALRNREILRQKLAQNPGNLTWRYHLGVCSHMLDDWPGAIEHFEAVLANPPKTLNVNVDLYQGHVLLLTAYARLKRPGEARRALERALKRFPARRHLWTTAGMLYLDQDDPLRAAEALEHTQTLSPSSDSKGMLWPAGKLEKHLFQAHLLLGNLAGAKKAYLAMLSQTGQLTPPLSGEMLQQAQDLFAAEAYPEVIALLEPLAQADAVALRILARACVRHQAWGKAAVHLAAAIALGGPRAGEWVDLAGCAFKGGNMATAQRFCHLALAQDAPDIASLGSKAAALNLLGVIAIEQKDRSQALTYFVQAVLAAADNQPARDNLAQASRALGLSSAAAIRRHGEWLIRQSSYPQAAAALAVAIEFDPQDVEAHKLLAITLKKMGQEENALLCWQMAQHLAAGAAVG